MPRSSKPKQGRSAATEAKTGRVPRSSDRASDRALYDRLVKRALEQGSKALYADPAFFDRLYGRRRDDVAFYLECAKAQGGPVLELGVGTGRIALALAAAGVSVVGVDSMPTMLAAARVGLRALPKTAQQNLKLVRGDMRRFDLGRRFPLVFAPFNAFTHLYSRDDFERALLVCHRHLQRDGRMIFDVVMPDLGALLQPPDRVYACGQLTDPRDGRRYRHLEASHYDPVTQVRTATLLFEPFDPDGTRRVIPLTQRQFFPAELEALLTANGFEIEARYGDFKRGALDMQSESQVVIARVATRSKRSSQHRDAHAR